MRHVHRVVNSIFDRKLVSVDEDLAAALISALGRRWAKIHGDDFISFVGDEGMMDEIVAKALEATPEEDYWTVMDAIGLEVQERIRNDMALDAFNVLVRQMKETADQKTAAGVDIASTLKPESDAVDVNEPPRTGPQLSRHDSPDGHVPERMEDVAAEIAERHPELYEKLALLHDHKGYLEVAWHDKPTAAEWAIVARVWETVGEELSENVRCHHTCPRCRGSGVGNGCRVNG